MFPIKKLFSSIKQKHYPLVKYTRCIKMFSKSQNKLTTLSTASALHGYIYFLTLLVRYLSFYILYELDKGYSTTTNMVECCTFEHVVPLAASQCYSNGDVKWEWLNVIEIA